MLSSMRLHSRELKAIQVILEQLVLREQQEQQEPQEVPDLQAHRVLLDPKEQLALLVLMEVRGRLLQQPLEVLLQVSPVLMH
jgi:K+/H+ antiporter YhaU regulatory subunit KhtT